MVFIVGVTIATLMGDNGILTKSKESEVQTEIGEEKEYITLSMSAIKGDKILKGDTSEITSSELQIEMNKYTDEVTVTGVGILIVTYESGRIYEVEQDGNITQKEELTPEEAKKIVYATGCGEGVAVETADGTVYYIDNLQEEVIKKIEITDAEVITTNGIKKAGKNYFIDNKGKVYTWGENKFGQLGNGTEEDSNKPICISDLPENVLNGKNIIEIQNDATMIALDSEGKLYTWGLDFMAEPICISDIPETTLSGKNIVKMKKGDLELLLLDDEGKVYEFENMHTPPICITDVEGTELYNKKIKDINVSIGSSSRVQAYITEDGELYAYIKQLPS